MIKTNLDPQFTIIVGPSKYSHKSIEELIAMIGFREASNDNTAGEVDQLIEPPKGPFTKTQQKMHLKRRVKVRKNKKLMLIQKTERRMKRTSSKVKLPQAAFNHIEQNPIIISWPPTDQDQCGSCWAFALSEVLTYRIMNNRIVPVNVRSGDMVSQQYLMDCVNRRVWLNGQNTPLCDGCNGCIGDGSPEVRAIRALALIGTLPNRRNYPFLNGARNVNIINHNNCLAYGPNVPGHYNYNPVNVWRIGNQFLNFYNSLQNRGPFYSLIRIGNTAQYAFQATHILGGYLNNNSCKINEFGPNQNHAVAIFGYGRERRSFFGALLVGVWVVKNSWNENYYLKFLAEDGDNRPNTCQLMSNAYAFQ